MNQPVVNPRSEREILTQKYDKSRVNLLLVIVLTLLNIVFISLNNYTMMLFSATVPYLSVAFGKLMESQAMLIAGYAIAAICLVLYFVCWILSKKNYGWFVAATVLFAIDTVCMALFYISAGDFSGITDAIIHVLILGYLIIGITTGAKLKKLPEESSMQTSEAQPEASATTEEILTADIEK